MSLQRFIKVAKSARGSDVSLRSVFPGRGRQPTKDRAEVLAAFVAADNGKIDGVLHDKRRGVFVAVAAPVVAVAESA